MRSLVASLGDHPMAMLRAIANVQGVTLASNVREDAAAQLCAVLMEPGRVEAALAGCSPDARAAWAALLASGGQIKIPAFARSYGSVRPVGPGRLEREMPWQQPANPAEELWYRGLVYRGFADLGSGLAEYFYVPDEWRPPAAARHGHPAAAPAADLPAARPGSAAQDALNSLAVDACTLLGMLRDAPVRVNATGEWRAGDETHLRESLLAADPVRFALLITLAEELGWLVEERGRLLVATEAVEKWLRSSPWEQATVLFDAWRNSMFWNDLRRLPSLKTEGTWRNDPVLARRGILAALGGLKPANWYAITDLTARIKATNPDFQRPDGNYASWYLRDAATERYLMGFESWDDVEGRLIYFLVSEPLFWLGAVQLDSSAETHTRLFRLSPTGAAWLDDAPWPEAPQAARLKVSDDYTVSAPLLVPLTDRYRLLRCTEIVPGPREPGAPTRHRITRRSLARARADGLQGKKIAQFLSRASGAKLPAKLAAALARWDQQRAEVRVTAGAVLRVEEASALARLRADPVLGPLLGELLSAQAALVSTANLPRVLSALAELGYDTKVE